jgi:hypothetical protein
MKKLEDLLVVLERSRNSELEVLGKVPHKGCPEEVRQTQCQVYGPKRRMHPLLTELYRSLEGRVSESFERGRLPWWWNESNDQF